MEFKVLSKKISSARLGAKVKCEFIKEGKVEYVDWCKNKQGRLCNLTNRFNFFVCPFRLKMTSKYIKMRVWKGGSSSRIPVPFSRESRILYVFHQFPESHFSFLIHNNSRSLGWRSNTYRSVYVSSKGMGQKLSNACLLEFWK